MALEPLRLDIFAWYFNDAIKRIMEFGDNTEIGNFTRWMMNSDIDAYRFLEPEWAVQTYHAEGMITFLSVVEESLSNAFH